MFINIPKYQVQIYEICRKITNFANKICENRLHLGNSSELDCTRFALSLPIDLIVFCDMDYLPKDPAILVSSVNMLLRDEEFDSLESLCYAFSREPKEIKDYLLTYGFVWSEIQKQFRPIGYDA